MIDISILRAMANAGASTEVILAAIEADNALNDSKPVKRQRVMAQPAQRLNTDDVCFDGWPLNYAEQFWAAYPRKIGKGAALSKLTSIMKRGDVSFDTIMSAVKRIDTTLDKQFIPHPITWLNQGRWDDTPDSAEPALITGGLYYCEPFSPELEAWDRHEGRARRDKRGGWFYPTQWPPGHDKPLAATNGI